MSYIPQYEKTLITNGNVLTIDFTVPMQANDLCYVEVVFMGSTASGAATIVGKKGAFFKNVSGTASALGATENIVPTTADASLSTATFTITANGGNAIISITGVAATTITWNYTVSVFRKGI